MLGFHGQQQLWCVTKFFYITLQWWKPGIRHTYVNGVSDLGSSVATLLNTNSWLRLCMLLTDSNYSHEFQQIVNNGKGVPMEMWAFALPLLTYVLVGFHTMDFCPDTEINIIDRLLQDYYG